MIGKEKGSVSVQSQKKEMSLTDRKCIFEGGYEISKI
jgi:hypothetical protein